MKEMITYDFDFDFHPKKYSYHHIDQLIDLKIDPLFYENDEINK